MAASTYDTDNAFFSANLEDDVLVVRDKKHVIRHTTDLTVTDAFFDYVEGVARDPRIRAVVFFGSPDKPGGLETAQFYQMVLSSRREHYALERLFNLINTYTVALTGMDKITVRAECGRISSFHLNMGLACDYRIVTDDAIFENAAAELGLVTKGGGAYFLSRLIGYKAASEVLLWNRFSAEEALNLGIVDRVAPRGKLDDETMRFARSQLSRPISTLIGVRKLLKTDVDALKKSLATEDLLIHNRVNHPDFAQDLDRYLQGQTEG
ncbi:enoyl-CoA hydratase/isomerase family protein [Desulfolutivibrio sulfoxidireducens]|uniref:enoyl-CoA hydratase/isomerase family protein n=1 Tax=Desulfolutivibrio sulfoxidireducens TaxID=2773299 RepID=UPI00159D7483|nr:enoyl-CoA hydratase/isomerase family protein [Desulfolutivibrio sulfoxidireducens]QLA17872.1 enoyl-CoA hydratase/isomerase family protein [Desulfolutivibrio sulfoxidireducens]QLA21452.1 enoyl-CoA hydratase/isomerase family protein [Desulfolutivibrio sulfoxidireducens]